LLPVISLAIISTANAQQGQTVEGAGTFLTMLAERGDLTLNLKCGPDDYVCDTVTDQYCSNYTSSGCAGNYIKEQIVLKERPVKKFEFTQNCVAKIFFVEQQQQISNPNTRNDVLSGGTEIRSFSINWGSVSGVKVTEDKVYFNKPVGSDGPFTTKWRLKATSSDLAARIGFAIDFLRLNCDPTNRTGF